MWFGTVVGQDGREEKVDRPFSRPGSMTAILYSPIPVVLISHILCNVLIKSYYIITLINFSINLKMEAAFCSVMFVSAYNTARNQTYSNIS